MCSFQQYMHNDIRWGFTKTSLFPFQSVSVRVSRFTYKVIFFIVQFFKKTYFWCLLSESGNRFLIHYSLWGKNVKLVSQPVSLTGLYSLYLAQTIKRFDIKLHFCLICKKECQSMAPRIQALFPLLFISCGLKAIARQSPWQMLCGRLPNEGEVRSLGSVCKGALQVMLALFR